MWLLFLQFTLVNGKKVSSEKQIPHRDFSISLPLKRRIPGIDFPANHGWWRKIEKDYRRRILSGIMTMKDDEWRCGLEEVPGKLDDNRSGNIRCGCPIFIVKRRPSGVQSDGAWHCSRQLSFRGDKGAGCKNKWKDIDPYWELPGLWRKLWFWEKLQFKVSWPLPSVLTNDA